MSRGPSKSEPLKDAERIRIDEVMRLTGVPRSTLYNWMKKGLFPTQAKKPAGTRGAYWHRKEVLAWRDAGRNETAVQEAPVAVGPAPKAAAACPPASHGPAKVAAAPEKQIPEKQRSVRLIGLEKTGIVVMGHEVYRHVVSRRILMDIGTLLPDHFAAAATEEQNWITVRRSISSD